MGFGTPGFWGKCRPFVAGLFVGGTQGGPGRICFRSYGNPKKPRFAAGNRIDYAKDFFRQKKKPKLGGISVGAAPILMGRIE